VRKECRAQIERAIYWGYDVTHLDSHLGAMQVRAEFFDVYLELGLDFGLPLRMLPESLALLPARAPLLILGGYALTHLFEHALVPHFHFGEETHVDVVRGRSSVAAHVFGASAWPWAALFCTRRRFFWHPADSVLSCTGRMRVIGHLANERSAAVFSLREAMFTVGSRCHVSSFRCCVT